MLQLNINHDCCLLQRDVYELNIGILSADIPKKIQLAYLSNSLYQSYILSLLMAAKLNATTGQKKLTWGNTVSGYECPFALF